MHMAIGAVVNAAWDLAAKRAGQPLWRFLADAEPRVARLPGRLPLPHRRADPSRGAGNLLRAGPGRAARRGAALLERRLPRLHHLARLARLLRREADPARQGGAWPRASRRSSSRSAPTSTTTSAGCRVAREAIGPDIRMAVDANQRWDVAEAIALDPGRWPRSTRTGSRSRPAPTTSSGTPRSAPVAPVKVATGEHVHNRVVFKQLLQAGAIDFLQIDAGPGRRRQREPRDPAAGGQVRRPGLPARGRGGAVRTGAAPGDVRLRRGLRHDSRTA